VPRPSAIVAGVVEAAFELITPAAAG